MESSCRDAAPPGAVQGAVLRRALHPTAREVRRSSLWLSEVATKAGVPDEPAGRLDLCLNEILANLMEHAGVAESPLPVELELRLLPHPRGRAVSLVIRDPGAPFDPLQFRPRERPDSLAEAVPGGLGLVLVRRCADELSYRRRDDRNELTVTVHWPAEG